MTRDYLKGATIFLVIVLVMNFTYSKSLASNMTLYVNTKKQTLEVFDEYQSTTMVPLSVIVQEMGAQFEEPDRGLAKVTLPDGTTYDLDTTSFTALKNGKEDIAMMTKVEKGVVVPVMVTPMRINSAFYVPVSFIKDVLKYPVVIEKNAVYIGKKGQSPDPKEPNQPNQPTNPKNPYQPPKGWKPPVVKSVAGKDRTKNMEVLAKELGLRARPGGMSFYGGELTIDSWEKPSMLYELKIQMRAWRSSNTPEINQIPYYVKETLRFYMPKDYLTVYNLIAGVKKGIPIEKMFQVGSRQFYVYRTDEFAVIKMGEPGVRYNEYWKAIGKLKYSKDVVILK